MTTRQSLIEDIGHIVAWISPKEMLLLYDLAAEVPIGGEIVEVGSCYGASSACLGLGAQDKAYLTLIDSFIWHPSGPASAKLLESNLKSVGLSSFVIYEIDCMSLENWPVPIDLLYIDGAHDYTHVWHDLTMLGPQAKTIVCHDYTTIPDVTKAVDGFVPEYSYRIDRVVHRMAVLRRIDNG